MLLFMGRLRGPVLLLCALGQATGATEFFPLQDIKAGMHGVGKTVFSGGRIDDFDVEILGVLDNIGPKESLILARLSGGPLASTGVLQGMSGSPVYIDGKLVGAVAMAFPFSKEPIAGIRPIADMLASGVRTAPRAAVRWNDSNLLAALPARGETSFGQSKMMDVSTPVSFGGFTRKAIERFAPQLRALGLEPMQGVSSGGRMATAMGPRSALQPGSMISVQLLTGDMSMGADGTVTYIDGERLYAFGHRFLSVGSTDLPFARSEVLTLLPSLSSSFKISSPRELMGAISQDHDTAIAGRLGQRAAMVPVSVTVSRAGGGSSTYHMEMAGDRFLSPFLLQMSVFSAIDATERTSGASSLVMRGRIEFQNGHAPVKLDNTFAADGSTAALAALSAAIPLAYVLEGGFDSLRVKSVAVEIESTDGNRQLLVDHAFAGRREARPGEPIELTIGLAGENGAQVSRKVVYKTPPGMAPGPLYFTIADAGTTNLYDLRQMFFSEPRSAQQLVANLNRLKTNNKAYVRVWRPDPAFQLQGEDYPAPPPSLALIFARSQGGYGGLAQTLNSKIAELEIDGGGFMVSGSKTIQVDIKE
jgi:hypothetical protein